MSRPRLSKRVLKGLIAIGQAVSNSTLPPSPLTEPAAALDYIRKLAAWKAAPRVKGRMPPQLKKRLQKRYR